MVTMDRLREHIIDLELSFFDNSVRFDRHRLDVLLHDDFTEIGSSGMQYGKTQVMEFLSTPNLPPINASEFELRVLVPTLVQLTYRTVSYKQDGTVKNYLRSSLWRQSGDDWQLLFHQGTVIQDMKS